MLAQIPTSLRKTLNVDNDKEFANQASIARKLDADAYLTLPYTSQYKGTVENRIGVIRQFITQVTDLRSVTNKGTKILEHNLID